MKKFSFLASFISLSSLISSPAIAASFSTIYGFGDSLSGTGNLNQIIVEETGGNLTFPPSPSQLSSARTVYMIIAEQSESAGSTMSSGQSMSSSPKFGG